MPAWWQDEALADDIRGALGFVKCARRRRRRWAQDACGDYFDALNHLWDTLYAIPPLNEKPPPRLQEDRLCELVKTIEPVEQDALLVKSSVKDLADFEPPILNNKFVDRCAPHMSQRRYNDIPIDIRDRASLRHVEFKDGLARWLREGGRCGDLLNRLSRVVIVVRNNLRHGGKTRFGPETEREGRNHEVSKIVLPVLEDILDFVLDRPSEKLATHGTLRPGQPNHPVLDIDLSYHANICSCGVRRPSCTRTWIRSMRPSNSVTTPPCATAR